MIETLTHDDDFMNNEVVEHILEDSGSGSGRFNLLVGLAFLTERVPANYSYTVRIFSGAAEMASATREELVTLFAAQEIGHLRIEASQIPIDDTDLKWFPTKVFQAKGSYLELLLESNSPDLDDGGEPPAQIGDENVPIQIKVIEHDVDAAA